MAEQRSLKRITRADALVVGLICLLLIVLVPLLLAKPREQSVRQVCGANLAQIGKTMLLYANDYQGALPRAGGPTSVWGPVPCWDGLDRQVAYGIDVNGHGGAATINSCFYLLVKHYEAPTRLFTCRGDKGTTEFKLSNLATPPARSFKLSDAWDFGPTSEACKHCSYSYHVPFGLYSLATARDPNFAVAADRNPWIESPMGAAADLSLFKPHLSSGGFAGTTATACMGNAITHGRDGQNVLFLDGRVTFGKRAYCGINNDNIYLISRSSSGGDAFGTVPPVPIVTVFSAYDSVLVHDPPGLSYRAKPTKP